MTKKKRFTDMYIKSLKPKDKPIEYLEHTPGYIGTAIDFHRAAHITAEGNSAKSCNIRSYHDEKMSLTVPQ